jgi:hypothetical protein
VRISLQCRRQYLANRRERCYSAKTSSQKCQIRGEVVATLSYVRRCASAVLRHPPNSTERRVTPLRRRKYEAPMLVIQPLWEAVDNPCAEHLHLVRLSRAEQLGRDGEIALTHQVRRELTQISRATLAWRMAAWHKSSAKRVPPAPSCSPGSAPRPLWTCIAERSPGCFGVDLVGHTGGPFTGHFANTLSVVDIVMGYSRRQAIPGRSKRLRSKPCSASWPRALSGLGTARGQWC